MCLYRESDEEVHGGARVSFYGPSAQYVCVYVHEGVMSRIECRLGTGMEESCHAQRRGMR